MWETEGPSSVFSSPECDFALEWLQGKSYFGVNYDKKSPIIKKGRPTTPFPNIRIKIQYYVCYFQQAGTQFSCLCACKHRNYITGHVFGFQT